MEINKVNGDILGVVTSADTVEGRMVCLTSHSFDNDFGSQTDLPAAKVPSTLDEARRARFILTWQVDNRTPPYYVPQPAYAFSLRNGFGSAANVPFSATVHLTYPGYKNSVTIPSGTSALAFGAGTFTVPSGQYIYSTGLRTPGALVSVSYSGADAGKLQEQATYDADLVVGMVENFDSTTFDLRVVTKEF